MLEKKVFIAVGSNLGRRRDNVTKALNLLGKIEGVSLEKVSSIIETTPCGGPPQRNYLNGVIKITTSLSAEELLFSLQEIERKLGRIRGVKNGPRTLDLDILLYGETIIDRPFLKIPHPRLFEREFVLKPLFEIAPELKELVMRLELKAKR